MPKVPNTIRAAADCNWTDSRYFSFIRSALRRASVKYPVKFQVLKAAQRPYEGTDRRTKWEYQCNSCKGWFKTKEVSVDHIIPAGSLKSYDDLPQFVSTLFCTADNLQVLCKQCHDKKSKEERKRR